MIIQPTNIIAANVEDSNLESFIEQSCDIIIDRLYDENKYTVEAKDDLYFTIQGKLFKNHKTHNVTLTFNLYPANASLF